VKFAKRQAGIVALCETMAFEQTPLVIGMDRLTDTAIGSSPAERREKQRNSPGELPCPNA